MIHTTTFLLFPILQVDDRKLEVRPHLVFFLEELEGNEERKHDRKIRFYIDIKIRFDLFSQSGLSNFKIYLITCEGMRFSILHISTKYCFWRGKFDRGTQRWMVGQEF